MKPARPSAAGSAAVPRTHRGQRRLLHRHRTGAAPVRLREFSHRWRWRWLLCCEHPCRVVFGTMELRVFQEPLISLKPGVVARGSVWRWSVTPSDDFVAEPASQARPTLADESAWVPQVLTLDVLPICVECWRCHRVAVISREALMLT